MVGETVCTVLAANPPTHVFQDIRGTLSTAANLHTNPNVVAVKQCENGLNRAVVSGGGCRNKSEEDPDSIVMSIAVDDAFCSVAALLRRRTRTG